MCPLLFYILPLLLLFLLFELVNFLVPPTISHIVYHVKGYINVWIKNKHTYNMLINLEGIKLDLCSYVSMYTDCFFFCFYFYPFLLCLLLVGISFVPSFLMFICFFFFFYWYKKTVKVLIKIKYVKKLYKDIQWL